MMLAIGQCEVVLAKSSMLRSDLSTVQSCFAFLSYFLSINILQILRRAVEVE